MRNIVLILDGCGCGAMPDAEKYKDAGANTLGNLSRERRLDLPNFQDLGLGNTTEIDGVGRNSFAIGSYGRMAEKSPGKDSTTGHWEMFGVTLDKPFPTYPNGFPQEVVERFEKAINRKILGNKPASGTEIIKEYWNEHKETGRPIVYTSADSVFQIAAHKDVIPLDELYKMCEVARKQLKGEHAVGRVIARPFIGEPGNFQRTSERKDYSLPPPRKTLLDYAKGKGCKVLGIGKIDYLFANRGLTKCIHTTDNTHGIRVIDDAVKNNDADLIVANLIDFDMTWGHRRNAEGYAKGLKEVDDALPDIEGSLDRDDVFYITSDHGNDPTLKSHWNHTREYVPLLVYGEETVTSDLGTRETFADVGQTIADYLRIRLDTGTSFRRQIDRRAYH